MLVNNAGIQHVAPIERFPVEKWDQILAINLSSAFHTHALALPAMREKRFGRIINIASAHGLVASPFKAAYVAAKHGIVGLTKVAALETAEDDITCNAICPGYVYTPLVEAQIDGQAKAHGIPRDQVIRDVLLAQQPNKRFATVEELGALTRLSVRARRRLDHRHGVAGRRRLDGALKARDRRNKDRIGFHEQAQDYTGAETSVSVTTSRLRPETLPGQVVLVLQGGGALGSYQAGVYQALHEAGIEPDWIIGTSIGAINASLIAGNDPRQRLDASAASSGSAWSRSRRGASRERVSGLQRQAVLLVDGHSRHRRLLQAQSAGARRRHLSARAGARRLLHDHAATRRLSTNWSISTSSTAAQPRLTVGAAHVRTSQMRYFDSRDGAIGVKHVMASGALPPAFPGGAHRRRAVLGRRHPLEYADRSGVRRQPAAELADLRRAPVESDRHRADHDGGGVQPAQGRAVFEPDRQPDRAAAADPSFAPRHQPTRRATAGSERSSAAVRELASYGCHTRMHVVRLLAPQLDRENPHQGHRLQS